MCFQLLTWTLNRAGYCNDATSIVSAIDGFKSFPTRGTPQELLRSPVSRRHLSPLHAAGRAVGTECECARVIERFNPYVDGFPFYAGQSPCPVAEPGTLHCVLLVTAPVFFIYDWASPLSGPLYTSPRDLQFLDHTSPPPAIGRLCRLCL